MTKLEALCYGVQIAEGWDPGSRSWRNNNPGNLRSSPLTSETRDNFAVFPTYENGWHALWLDLWIKCAGRSKTGLTPTSTLREFVEKYARPTNEDEMIGYLNNLLRATGADEKTQLAWFLQDTK